MATTDSSFERGVQPSMRLAFWLVPFFGLPSSGRICFTAGSRSAAMRTSQLGSWRVGTFLADAPRRRFEHLGDVEHRSEITGDRKESFAFSGRIGHGADVQIGDVAHVHDTEIQLRTTWQSAVHQALYDEDRSRIVGPQDRTEHSHRVNNGELETAAFVGDEVPSGTLGQSLRFGYASTSPLGSVQLVSSKGVVRGLWP